jgi:hypothetical protein
MKKILFTITILASIALVLNYVHADIYDSALKLWWNMDNNQISGTSLTDVSGTVNTGTLTGSPTTGTAGRSGQSITFNGSSQYVTTSGNVMTGMTAFTICAWVRYDGSGNRFLTSSQPQTVPVHSGTVETAVGGTVALTVYNTGVGGDFDNYNASQTAPTNVWTHMCWQWDSSHTISIYFNAVKDSGTPSNAGTRPTAVNGAYPVNVGRGGNSAGSYRFFGGDVDDVRIYNRVLTNSEVAQVYLQGVWHQTEDF